MLFLREEEHTWCLKISRREKPISIQSFQIIREVLLCPVLWSSWVSFITILVRMRRPYPNIPEELTREATFMSSKASYSLNNFDDALRDFRKVATEVTSIEGAESKYRVAELLNKKDKSAEAEKVITEFIDQKSPHQFWMARVFLLLADISIKKGDSLQARATLQSLKDYYKVDNDGILDEVKAKLNSLDENKPDTDKNDKVQNSVQQ